ncbi:cupin domain-containing protein [Kitasatospora sp. NPDC005856]|uniref:cupin domain-containing protein n=1 Tax=Kitasatospora sp. NPDC005856 TaxID=3154566 RepID=UPI0033F575D7
MRIVPKDRLPVVRINGEIAAHVFDGAQHGDVGSSAFVVDLPPGPGPRRHLHPYDEIFVVVRGTARIEADGRTHELTPDEICVVPAGTAHTFTAVGPDRVQMVNIHVARQVHTVWADETGPDHSYEYGHTS